MRGRRFVYRVLRRLRSFAYRKAAGLLVLNVLFIKQRCRYQRAVVLPECPYALRLVFGLLGSPRQRLRWSYVRDRRKRHDHRQGSRSAREPQC